MNGRISITVLSLVLLAGCSSGSGDAGKSGATATPGTSATTANATGAGKADTACSAGLSGNEPGVLSVNCNGTADILVQAGSAHVDLHGGTCRSASDIWSATAGVIIDETGLHGTYAGPKVNGITVNNTDTKGKATIQAVIGGTHYFDLGSATLTQSSDSKTAHIEGTSDPLSDEPGAKIVVDITC